MSGRELAGWAAPGNRRSRLLGGLISDARRLAAGARWSGPDAATGTAETPDAGGRDARGQDRANRGPVGRQSGSRRGGSKQGGSHGNRIRPRPMPDPRGLFPGLPPRAGIDAGGADTLPPDGPMLLVANHPIEKTAALIRAALPLSRRLRLLVLPRGGFGSDPKLRDKALDALWAGRPVLVFSDPGSADGELGEFDPGIAELATRAGAALVPVGVRGAVAATTNPGRNRVGVRFGRPLPAGQPSCEQPAGQPSREQPAGQPSREQSVGEQPAGQPSREQSGAAYGPDQLRSAVLALISEDEHTWFRVRRDLAEGRLEVAEPPADEPSGWRRVWQQTARPAKGGAGEAPRIWR